MPRGDGRGPLGQGPMTGRGAGFCAGFGRPGFSGRSLGQGPGRGFGGGRRGWWNIFQTAGLPGWRRFGAADQGMGSEQEKRMLKQQAETLEKEAADIRKRLEAMDTADKNE